MQKANNFGMVLMADKSKAEAGNEKWPEAVVRRSLEHTGRID